MFDIFAQMTPWHWLIIGIALLALEAIGIGGFFIGMALSSLFVSVCAWLGMHWAWQFFTFGVLSIVLSYLYWKYFKNFNDKRHDSPNINDRLANMRGQYGYVIEVVSDTLVKAKFGDTLWRCRTESRVAKDQKVEVIDFDDTTLIVKNVD